MAEKFWVQRPHSRYFEIGVSKHSCWFCEKYLEYFVQSSSGFHLKMKVLMTGYQGKLHPGWKLPANGPLNAAIKMNDLLRREMDEILKRVEQERMSDSGPRDSCEDDNEEEEEEEERGIKDLGDEPGIWD